MLSQLILPIVLSTVALFIASFLSWMVFQLHKKDWSPVEKEDDLMAAIAAFHLPVGSHMFPFAKSNECMKSETFQKKYAAGPRGILTIMPTANMGALLGQTVLYFLGVSFLLAYLASIAFHNQTDTSFMDVFRFVFTAGFMTFFAAILAHSIWFRARIVGHLIESLAYAAIVAVLFASLWPKA